MRAPTPRALRAASWSGLRFRADLQELEEAFRSFPSVLMAKRAAGAATPLFRRPVLPCRSSRRIRVEARRLGWIRDKGALR